MTHRTLRNLTCGAGLLLALGPARLRLSADEPRPVRLMASLEGAHCSECVRTLRDALGKHAGVRFEAGDVRAEGGSEHRSSRFALELAAPEGAAIGAVARHVAEAATPHRERAAPGLFLLFPWKATRSPREQSFEACRGSLSNLQGVDQKASFPGDRYIWIRLDGSGKAHLRELAAALVGCGLIDDPLGPGESAGWLLDYATAKRMALELRKPILLVFR